MNKKKILKKGVVLLGVGLLFFNSLPINVVAEVLELTQEEKVTEEAYISSEETSQVIESESAITEEDSELESQFEQKEEVEESVPTEAVESKQEEIIVAESDQPVATALGDVIIDDIAFPDAVFRTFVEENIDLDGDGMLSNAEITEVTTLSVKGLPISDIRGVQKFKNLTSLNLSGTAIPELGYLDIGLLKNLTSLDVSNSGLLTLKLYNTKLETLNISGMANLEELVITGTAITELEVKDLPNLVSVYTSYNSGLTSLKINHTDLLREAFIYDNNALNSLEVKNLSSLETLEVTSNSSLNNLQIKDMNKLVSIDAGSNALTNIDISNTTSLTALDVSYNNLSNLDVSRLTSLEDIEFSENPNLSILDFRNLPNLVTAHHATNNETIYISAGMTNYIGCPAIADHTGNIVIDLKGVATINPDGSKSVKLSEIISSYLIAVFKLRQQPGYNPVTDILTIPAGENSSTFVAGFDGLKNPTRWTFYTDLNGGLAPAPDPNQGVKPAEPVFGETNVASADEQTTSNGEETTTVMLPNTGEENLNFMSSLGVCLIGIFIHLARKSALRKADY